MTPSPLRGGSIYLLCSGKRVFPLDIKPSDIDIEDVALGLAHEARYAGQTKWHYSVGQHCVHIYDLLKADDEDEATCKWGLLHDTSEYLLKDIPRPLKYSPGFGDQYRVYENQVMAVVCQAFDMDPIEPEAVEYLDLAVCSNEQRDLRGRDVKRPKPVENFSIPEWSPKQARREFRRRAKELGLL